MDSSGVNSAVLATIVLGGASGPPDLNTYPQELCNAPPGSLQDSLGYFNRKCGSYVAWMATQAGLTVPPYSELGLPGYWPSEVDPSWLVADPQPGDIAIVPIELPYVEGHAVYISWVQPNGNLVAKGYNGDGRGNFAMQIWAPSGVKSGNQNGVLYYVPFTLAYIRFPPLS